MRAFVLLTLLAIAGCPSADNGSSSDGNGTNDHPRLSGRIAMAELLTQDSVAVVVPGVADDMLRQAIDSIAPDAVYVSIQDRQRELGEGHDTLSVQQLAGLLDLDAVIGLRVARFGSLLGVDARLMDPHSDSILYHGRTFAFIRYRSNDDTKLLGPSLYTAIERIVADCNGDSVAFPVPLIVANVTIPSDIEIDPLRADRQAISDEGVRAIGDMLRYEFQHLVVLDVESRSRVYETVGLGMVNDLENVGDLERKAMYSLDIPLFLTSAIRSKSDDSVEFDARLHVVDGPSHDRVVDSVAISVGSDELWSLEVKKKAVGYLLEAARSLVQRHVDRMEGADAE